MSLLDDFSSTVQFIERIREPDGEGGFYVTWIEGAKFEASIVLDTSLEARIAEKQGVTNVYTIVTKKNIALEYHDVIKRLYDGKIFRVTSDGTDKVTLKSANIDMRVVTAEEWSLTK